MRNSWSESTKAFTRQAFEELSFVSHQGKVWMKHRDRKFGCIKDADAVQGHYVIYAPTGEEIDIFDSISDLIEHGWAID